MRFNQVEFGRRLKALRKERGMTQEELAAALSITPNHLGKIELGKRGISFDVLLGVSEVLDISLDVPRFPAIELAALAADHSVG